MKRSLCLLVEWPNRNTLTIVRSPSHTLGKRETQSLPFGRVAQPQHPHNRAIAIS
ncbi:MAG: hypothetical protein F6K19_38145 [Cyanothece sp. SIO1E1]|nr:hypothetical protein [Cyanothece sp. SIO1E1]